MSDVRSMNHDTKFDADVNFDEKRTSARFITHIGSQDVNATDGVAAAAFMGSADLNPVDHVKFGRCKRVRKSTQKKLGYQISLLEEKWQKLKSKMEQKLKDTEVLLYSTKNQITVAESMVQFNNILNMFNSAQNQYLQPSEEEDEADTWFEDIDNWVFEFKFTTG